MLESPKAKYYNFIFSKRNNPADVTICCLTDYLIGEKLTILLIHYSYLFSHGKMPNLRIWCMFLPYMLVNWTHLTFILLDGWNEQFEYITLGHGNLFIYSYFFDFLLIKLRQINPFTSDIFSSVSTVKVKFLMLVLQNEIAKGFFLDSPSSTSTYTWRNKPKKQQRYPFLHRQHATRLAVFWVGVWLIFSWVEKFSSLALTISIVIAASTHTYSIRNSAGCNKFTPVLRGLSSGILGNTGDNYLK